MIHKFQRMMIFLLVWLPFGVINAEKLPRGCEVTGFSFQDTFLVLNETGKQAFYLLQNRSDVQIEIERDKSAVALLQPRLQSKLDPSMWSAFAADIENLTFQCFSLADDNKVRINCSEVIDICQYPRAKFAVSNLGSYWIATNKPQAQIIKDAVAKGILLRW